MTSPSRPQESRPAGAIAQSASRSSCKGEGAKNMAVELHHLSTGLRDRHLIIIRRGCTVATYVRCRRRSGNPTAIGAIPRALCST